MGIGTTELLVILLIILVLFGGSKIPEIMKGLGKGIREFKSAKDGTLDEAAKPGKDAKGAPQNPSKT